MKVIIKKIISFFKITFYLLTWFIRQVLHEDFINYISYQKKNKPVIILGNGPSLTNLINDPDFNETRDKNDFCVVNFSILSPLFRQLKPEYLTIADPLFFQRPYSNEKMRLFMEELTKIDWNLNIVIPFKYYKQIIKETEKNSFIKIMPIHSNILSKRINNQTIRNLIYKKGLSCPRLQNVLVASIYSMINSGYKTIYLYGVDHSWTTQLCVNAQNQVCLRDLHYYDDKTVELKPWLKGSGEIYKMHEVLRDLAHMFDSYHELQNYANYINNTKIINKSKESFIDAFTKA